MRVCLIVFEDTSAGQRSCFGHTVQGINFVTFSGASCHSPVSNLEAKSKTAASCLQMKHCQPFTCFVDSELLG